MRHGRLIGLVVVAMLMGGLGVAYASQRGLYGGHSQSQRNRLAAFADASRLLARLQVPSNAGVARTVPRGQLQELEGAMNHADVAARWLVPGTLSSVIGYVRHHPPEGSHYFSSGYSSSQGSVTSRSITFAWSPVDEVLADRHLYVSVSSAHHGEVELFAQAESIWLSARPLSERFPASVRRIVLRISHPGRPAVAHVVARASTVRRILELFNAVPITQPDVYNCPSLTGLRSFSYRLQGQNRATLAEVRYQVPPRAAPTPCDPMAVIIFGHHQHDLLGGPQSVEIQRIFGIPTDSAYL